MGKQEYPQRRKQERGRTEGQKGKETQWRKEKHKGGGLIKRDITRDANATSNRVIVKITLMLEAVTKKHTRDRLSCEFCSLPRGKPKP